MLEDSFIILLYHGVTQSEHKGIENYSQKHIQVDEFDEQMAHLALNYNVMPLGDLLDQRDKGKIPHGSVAVTFDDGFANNYSAALPILRDRGIPATFYLSTGFINSDRVFWVDKCEYLINESSEIRMALPALGKTYDIGSREQKEQALTEIKTALKNAPHMIEDTMIQLEQASKSPTRYDYEDYRILTWDQVRAMHQSGLCEFGSHTVDHAILSHLSREEKWYQVYESKRTLERELGRDVFGFSYPEGRESDYDDETIQLLRDAGFTSSPSAIFGINTERTSRFHLKRNMVGFTAQFDSCLEGNYAHRG